MRYMQTMYVCRQDDSHIIVYSKSEKLLELAPHKAKTRLPLLINDDCNPVAITRYEYVYRPQQSGSTLILKNLNKMSYMFKSVDIYSPTILGNLDDAERQIALKDGLMVYLKNTYDEASFMSRQNELKRYSLYIKHEQFKSLQENVLLNLRNCITLTKSDDRLPCQI